MKKKEYKILFCCGDKSADKYLAILLKKIKELSSNIKIYSLAGDESKDYSDFFLENLVNYDAHGFFSPFFQFFKFFFLLKKVKKLIKKDNIDTIVLLDYYGFNIRIAKIGKKIKAKVIYYITPQVWATRKYRLKKIKKYVDFVINIYPFEKELYESLGIKNYYFGHPIVDIIQSQNNIIKDKNLIGIFAGSRKQVIKWNLPVIAKIIDYYYVNYVKSSSISDNLKFIIFGFKKYESLYKNIIKKYLSNKCLSSVELCLNHNEELRERVALAISVSGTVVLENVFYNTPTIVIYKLPYLMYIFIKKIIYIKFISLPNIILKREIIPEFVQNINIQTISEKINIFLNNQPVINKLLEEYSKVKTILSEEKDVSLKVAKKIIEYTYEQI